MRRNTTPRVGAFDEEVSAGYYSGVVSLKGSNRAESRGSRQVNILEGRSSWPPDRTPFGCQTFGCARAGISAWLRNLGTRTE